MKLKTRMKIAAVIILTSLIVSGILAMTGLEQILTGYEVTNGMEKITYVPKLQGVLIVAVTPVGIGLMWNFAGKRNDQKIKAEPKLSSHRLRGAVIDFVFFLWTLLPLALGIANVVIWLIS